MSTPDDTPTGLDLLAVIHRLTMRYGVNAAQALALRLAAELPADRVQACIDDVTAELARRR